jgi:hypothetical protein
VRKAESGWWVLRIPALNYSGGWDSWQTCMMGLRLHYQNPKDSFLNARINMWRKAHTYDGYFQFSLYDWNRLC